MRYIPLYILYAAGFTLSFHHSMFSRAWFVRGGELVSLRHPSVPARGAHGAGPPSSRPAAAPRHHQAGPPGLQTDAPGQLDGTQGEYLLIIVGLCLFGLKYFRFFCHRYTVCPRSSDPFYIVTYYI